MSHSKVLNILFSFIAGIAFAASVFILAGAFRMFAPDWERMGFIFVLVFLPLFSQVIGALALERDWFRANIRSSTLIDAMHWISGIFGVAAIFDLTMRLTRHTQWMMSGRAPFIIDAIFVTLFFLWLLTSLCINREMKAKKACRFC